MLKCMVMLHFVLPNGKGIYQICNIPRSTNKEFADVPVKGANNESTDVTVPLKDPTKESADLPVKDSAYVN